MKKKIIFDASVLVSGNVSGDIHKTGLYRVSFEILKELNKSDEIELYLFDTFHRERELIKYVQKKFPQCERIKVYSFWYSLIIFPLGNLADYLRNAQQLNNTQLILFISKLFKNILLLIEKIARKTERMFFIKNNLAKSFNKCDVYYSTYFPIPEQVHLNPKLKKVYTMHDIIPILHPEYFSSPYNQRIVKEVVDQIGTNDYVIAVSESTKRDLLKYRPDISYEHIVVAPLAASSIFYMETNQERIEQIRNKYHIRSDKYILSLCTLEPRKNLMLLIRGYKKLLKQNTSFDLQLVLIGIYGWNSSDLMDEIKEINNTCNNPIILTGYVADEDLSALYSGAYIFVYPSMYEGFGLPVLEAMQCGVPVICSNTSSLPEVIGNCGILVHPDNMNELADSILYLYNDKSYREQLKQRSKERAELFNWSKTASTISNVFNSVLSENE